MNAPSFDQQAWLDRIGYSSSLQPTLDTLHKLIFTHSHTIAYESLDIMLGDCSRRSAKWTPPAGAHENAQVRRGASGTADQLSTELSSLFSTKATRVPTSAIDTYS